MKKLTFLLVLFFSFLSVWAQVGRSEKSAEDYLNLKGEVYFSFPVPGPETFKAIANNISIDNIMDGKVFAYANAAEFEFFSTLVTDYQVLEHPGDANVELNMATWEDIQNKNLKNDWDFYPTYPAYVSMMYQFETDFPDLCKIYDIGTTVLERQLLFAKITADVNQRKAEPQFMYTSTMHGDETAGFVLSLRLIHYLLNNYGVDDAITELLDNVEIWICPNENPDGTYTNNDNTVSGAMRGNANWVDLNRNYPNPVSNPSQAQQPETTAMINFVDTMHFVMSANMHGGIECINYPFDSWTSSNPANRHADHLWWQFVSHEYADTARYYSPSYYMNPSGGSFFDGVTHGGDWYVIYGSRQDYMNYYAATRELTLELSDQKLLTASLLPAHWEYNYRSFLNYIQQATYGLRGTVSDAISGQPLVATIEVIGHDQNNSEIFSDPLHGSFFRPLLAGTYNIVVSAAGYPPVEIYGVQVEDYQYVSLDVQMGGSLYADFFAQPEIIPTGGYVDFFDNSLGDVTSWNWSFEGGQPSTSQEPNPVNVVYPSAGNFLVSLTVEDAQDSDTSSKPGYIKVLPVSDEEEFLMSNNSVLTCSGYFYDSGGQNGNYGNNENFTFTFFPATQGDKLQFVFEQFELEAHSDCNWDWLKIYNGPTTDDPLLGTYCGTTSPGTITSGHPSGAVTFQFKSDGSTVKPGWKAAISCIPDFRRLYVTTDGQGGSFSMTGQQISGSNPWYFNYQQEVILQRISYPGFSHTGWEVNGTFFSGPTLELTMDENYYVKAFFEPYTGPVAIFEPDTVIFPAQIIQSYAEAFVSISNQGNEDLIISLDNISPSDIFGPLEPAKENMIIQPGMSDNFGFWFAPAEEGLYWGEAIFATNDPENSQVEIVLMGEAFHNAALIYSADTMVDFGEVAVGETVNHSIGIMNSGNMQLVIEGVEVSESVFSVNEQDFPVTLNPEETYDMVVSFTPGEKIQYQAFLTFISNASNESMKITLKGKGDSGVFTGDIPEAQLVNIFPNPVNQSTVIELQTQKPGNVEVVIFDIRGSLSKVIFSGFKEAGKHSLNAGQAFYNLDAGVYFVRISQPDKITTLRAVKAQ